MDWRLPLAAVAGKMGYVIFRIDGRQYALDSRQVREVTQAVAVRALPKAGELVEGVFTHRGRLVALLDIRRRFGLGRHALDPAQHFVIADLPGRRVAIRVDRVEQLAEIPAAEIADARQAVPEAEYVAGVAKLAGGLVLIHDLGTFLSACEADELDACLDTAQAASDPLP